MSDVLTRFGKRVREKRSALGYSQESFAAKAGLDRSYTGTVERGKTNLSLKTIDAIAKALGVSIAELMKGV